MSFVSINGILINLLQDIILGVILLRDRGSCNHYVLSSMKMERNMTY